MWFSRPSAGTSRAIAEKLWDHVILSDDSNVFFVVTDDAIDQLMDMTVAIPSSDFDDLYRGTFHSVRRVVVGISADPEVATEVTQEAFLAAHRQWQKVSTYDRPDLWVRRIAINRALSLRRRARVQANTVVPMLQRQTSVPEWMADDELWKRVRRLPRRQAAMVVLVYVDDMSVEDAASVLEISVPTAKTHLQRARKKLAQQLKEEM